MQQAIDFLEEARALHRVIAARPVAFLATPTLFKGWTVEEIVRHLHVWDGLADLARTDEEAFLATIPKAGAAVMGGNTRVTELELVPATGRALVAAWQARYERMGAEWAAEDPKRRLKWAGPSMSVRSSMTARIMEVWSHGQAIYDVAGLDRKPTPRLWNVVMLGINTFGWTHQVRDWPVPETMPLVRLTIGDEVKEWGDAAAGRIEGEAEHFAQVVTQTRNVADTALVVEGEVAQRWMENAQCFAGPPHPPPAPGSRHSV
ncbi:maleylpyruvate isomerase family mycothiol-dependent enzyme [Pontivivens ytuae]|uniref:Maleylpyruvate isomerase family mycothiol-dependent enzyme n=1 Tax=Pontivivens ytuae TaxID=2789856 RepID=A0A7S9QBA4_9RHOB|nr:maleylpyruvate isomerase family mycothiol-dependent enzyme [Pontivivens ytuae]QPH52983.1 maleylpyruvate isomerase family mycothiol-dependent enzyme [Pontivivens ytuae]